MLLLNQVLGMAAMVLYGVRALLSEERAFSMGIPVLFFILGAIPSLLAISCEFNARETLPVRVLDVALALLTGTLFVFLIFSLVNLVGHIDDAGIRKLNLVLALQGIFLATGATLRLFGTVHQEERRFFFILTATSWITVVLTNIRNYMTLGQVSPFWELIWNLVADTRALLIPIMIVAVYQPPEWLRSYQPSKKIIQLSRVSSTLFVGLALVVLGISVAEHHFRPGAVGLFLMLIGYGLRNALIQENLVQAEESLLRVNNKLEEMIALDGLTGIPNRRSFNDTLDREWRLSARTSRTLGILMIDIDHFKTLNDTYGHDVGDEVLSDVARVLQQGLPRTGDFVARYGGEEFAAILPGATFAGMEAVADRLRRAMHGLAVENSISSTPKITVSIGAALGRFESTAAAQSLVKAADMALYRAKDAGRDRIECIDLNSIVSYDDLSPEPYPSNAHSDCGKTEVEED
ncbi:GGDEF domain-containing protein [Terriglobus sp. ADX1]|uniref:GGDEF domain-containing protein n=1 Tax=Terriglobus sp. ADX1 TaxID=2794063 RepID=UPI002FE6BCB5